MDDAPAGAGPVVGDASLYAAWIQSLDARHKELAERVDTVQQTVIVVVLLVAMTLYVLARIAPKKESST